MRGLIIRSHCDCDVLFLTLSCYGRMFSVFSDKRLVLQAFIGLGVGLTQS